MKLFHVTFKKTLPKIKKQGIRPQKFSLWTGAAGQRLGEFGRVYAFSNINDAMRWAFSMQWETKKPTVIVEFEDNNPGRWEPDTHWQSCGAEGQWLKTFGAIKPEQLTAVHVVTPKDLKRLAKNPGEMHYWISRGEVLHVDSHHGDLYYEHYPGKKGYEEFIENAELMRRVQRETYGRDSVRLSVVGLHIGAELDLSMPSAIDNLLLGLALLGISDGELFIDDSRSTRSISTTVQEFKETGL